jgi:hypothetical protein
MTALSSGLFANWTEPSYEARVRGTAKPTYLWGSAGLTADFTFGKPLLLHVRNNLFGETITLATREASGKVTQLGTLAAGEFLSIPIQKISGVYATCDLESTVSCLIRNFA